MTEYEQGWRDGVEAAAKAWEEFDDRPKWRARVISSAIRSLAPPPATALCPECDTNAKEADAAEWEAERLKVALLKISRIDWEENAERWAAYMVRVADEAIKATAPPRESAATADGVACPECGGLGYLRDQYGFIRDCERPGCRCA